MSDERVNERAAFMSAGRMNNKTGWFIYDNEMGIFINNIERDLFCLWLGWRGRRHEKCDDLIHAETIGGFFNHALRDRGVTAGN